MKRAFTLIELLVVMAITAVLLGIIIVPLIQSFSMTRLAQSFAESQDRARILTDRIAAEIGNAASVRSSSGLVWSTVNGANVKLPQHSLIAVLPGKDGDFAEAVLNFSKIDIVKPAEGDPTAIASGGYVNPDTGLADPTLQAPKGQVRLPLTPGTTIIRYFIGLRDPFKPYNNPYDGILMARNGQQDN